MALEKIVYEKPSVVPPGTQNTSNDFPSYMRMRREPYSNYQQLFNVLRAQYKDMRDKIKIHKELFFVGGWMPSGLDMVYRVFHEEGTTHYLADGITYNETKEKTIHDWWYNSIPDTYVVVDEEALPIRETLVPDASGSVTVEQALAIPSRMFVKPVYSGSYRDMKANTGGKTAIIVYGIDDIGTPREEKLRFLGTQQEKTDTTWTYIDRVVLYSPYDKTQYSIHISSAPIKLADTLVEEPKDLVYGDDRAFMDLHYGHTSDHIFEYAPIASSSGNMIFEDMKMEKTFSYLLTKKDTSSGEQIYVNDLIDITPGHNDDLIYALVEDGIILYPKHKTVPASIKKISEMKTVDPMLTLSLDYQPDSEKIVVDCRFRTLRLGRSVLKYRVYASLDGDVVYLNTATGEFGDEPVDWTAPKTKDFYLQPFEISGNYEDAYVVVEALASTGETEVDAIAIVPGVKKPIAQIPMSIISPKKIYFSADNFLCVENDDTVYKLMPRLNTYCVVDDYAVFDHEITGLVAVGSGFALQKNQEVFNIETAIDSWATMHSIKRDEGERVYQFIPRLRYLFNNPIGSNRNGILTGISAGLNLPIKSAALLKAESGVALIIQNAVATVTNLNGTSESYLLYGKTIGQLISWLGTHDIFLIQGDGSILDKDADMLMDISTSRYYYYTPNPEDMIYEYDLSLFEKILPDTLSVSGMDESEYTFSGATIKFEKPVFFDNIISFHTYSEIFILKYCPIRMYDVNYFKEYPDEYVDHEKITMIKEVTELAFPGRWQK